MAISFHQDIMWCANDPMNKCCVLIHNSHDRPSRSIHSPPGQQSISVLRSVILPAAKTSEELSVSMVHVKEELPKRLCKQSQNATRPTDANLSGLLVRDLVGGLHSIQCNQPMFRSSKHESYSDSQDGTTHHPTKRLRPSQSLLPLKRA